MFLFDDFYNTVTKKIDENYMIDFRVLFKDQKYRTSLESLIGYLITHQYRKVIINVFKMLDPDILEAIVIDNDQFNNFKNIYFVDKAMKYILFKNDNQISQKYLKVYYNFK